MLIVNVGTGDTNGKRNAFLIYKKVQYNTRFSTVSWTWTGFRPLWGLCKARIKGWPLEPEAFLAIIVPEQCGIDLLERLCMNQFPKSSMACLSVNDS